MRHHIRFVGLDVHAETIAVAVVEPDGELRFLGTIPNRPEAIRRLMKRLGPTGRLRACYEAGPTGYVLYWQLSWKQPTVSKPRTAKHCHSIWSSITCALLSNRQRAAPTPLRPDPTSRCHPLRRTGYSASRRTEFSGETDETTH